jgi:hypothetical protein
MTKKHICGIMQNEAMHMGSENAWEGDEGRTYYDETSGEALPPKLVKQARQEELEFFANKKVWVLVPI